MKKRFLSLTLAVMMIASMANIAHAEDQTFEAVVTYGVSASYGLTVPESVVINPESNSGTATFEVESLVLPTDATLKIKISGADYVDKWELIHTKDANEKLEYRIGSTPGASDIKNNDVIFSATSGESEKEGSIHLSMPEGASVAGIYQDTLTFTVIIE